MFLYPTFNEGKYWQESVNIPRVIFLYIPCSRSINI